MLNDNSPAILGERKLLIILATDGEPTDSSGRVNIIQFEQLLASRPPIVFTNIICCSDDESSIGYLNRLDTQLPRLDVVDDFKSERIEVKRAKGGHFSFTFGDYVCKSLIVCENFYN